MRVSIVALAGLLCVHCPVLAGAAVVISDVFLANPPNPVGPGDITDYRIPALAVAPNGNLLAFVEARRGGYDPGSHAGSWDDIVCKVSTDGGATWGPMQTLATSYGPGNSNLYDYSDPRVVTLSSGTILLFYDQWPDTPPATYVTGLNPDPSCSSVAYMISSTDNGQTWSAPVNLNTQMRDPSWSELDTGPGIGIQLRWQTDPSRNGRIVIPAYTYVGTVPPTATSHALTEYSDDGGVTWQHSNLTNVDADEAQVVELTNGNLLMDARAEGASYREEFISQDGGATWGPMYSGGIPITSVNCSLIRYSAKRDGDDRDRLLFCGPSGDPPLSGNGRYNLTIWTSYDEGQTFINPVQIDYNTFYGVCPAGYSSMERLPDGSIAVLYEKTFAQTWLAKLTLADLEGQTFSPHVFAYDGFGNTIQPNNGGMGWSGAWMGAGTPASDYRAALGGTGLSFAGYPFPTSGARMDLIQGQTAERLLADPISLALSSTTYVSLLVTRALDAAPTSSPNQSFDVNLRDPNETNVACFGVTSSQQFYVGTPAGIVTTAPGVQQQNATYLMVLKLVAQNVGQANACDQVYLDVLQSGVDAIPSSDAGLNWTLAAAGALNSSTIDRIYLSGGANSIWSFSELRVGDTFGAVAGGVDTPAPFIWTGAASGNWNTAETNWKRTGGPTQYGGSSPAVFDDTGSNTNITIQSAGVSPASVVFNNSAAVSYTLGGGQIAGTGGLTVSGGGQVTLTGSNTYSGGTSVVDGLLLAENSSAIPTGSLLSIGASGSVVLGDPGYTELGLGDPPSAGGAINPVPEPSTLALLGVGAIGLLGCAWRRRL
jgi:autotransporter-associated beta strand protein